MIGVIAQLGERLNGIQEVGGSIPLNSTNFEISPQILLHQKTFINLYFIVNISILENSILSLLVLVSAKFSTGKRCKITLF